MNLLTSDTLTVAKNLLGYRLVHESDEGITAGIIVETEAYLQDDPACHAYRKKSLRNAPMFGVAGTVYVYQIYGMHFCVNIATNQKDIGEAVLIRALEPIEGIDLMEKRRKSNVLKNLCSGPGKLVQAMGIHKGMNDWHILENDLKILPPLSDYSETPIVTTTRIGITQGATLPYRFYLKDNSFISKK
ncbi:DNA-3-methyladenine glycosylase [Arcicella sp. DC2W]|uniref:Putative 3-methyladenine DNA glycosylase n=1 Tax=Arcicella gelida TaxID=2984195 RepID=A0ABU5SBT9_9BACT|nr:DNA-3-methyladenine glycosylase [Arcicella sp. DC2W]MEA5405917.1 DNA-3-methyladenine glycosylase [Arcicella sp. DC2W]